MELHSHCLNELALDSLYFLKTSLNTSLSSGGLTENTEDNFFELRSQPFKIKIVLDCFFFF